MLRSMSPRRRGRPVTVALAPLLLAGLIGPGCTDDGTVQSPAMRQPTEGAGGRPPGSPRPPGEHNVPTPPPAAPPDSLGSPADAGRDADRPTPPGDPPR